MLRILASALLAAASFPAVAGSILLAPDVDYTRLSLVEISFDAGGSYRLAYAGQIRVRPVKVSGFAFTTAEFYTFCVEPTEYLGYGPLDRAPLSSGDTAVGGMGTAKAGDVARLLGHAAPNLHASLGPLEGAAIQLALWEIVREEARDYGLGDGTFRARGPSAAVSLANLYLAGIDRSVRAPDGVNAIVADGRQDLLIQTPAPPAAALFGLGLVPLFISGRCGILKKRPRRNLCGGA